MNPKYSICITHYNNMLTLTDSLSSLLNQINSEFEIVVVDNKSSDGSRAVLESYSRTGKLKLISIRCSRGKGRQIALENSSAPLIISNLDLDDIFKPRLIELLAKYHEKCEGTLLWANSVDGAGFWGVSGAMVAPRILLERIGGWRNLQIGEDWELARRTELAGQYRWTRFQLIDRTNPQRGRRTLVGRAKFRYSRYRDLLRCGRPVFDKGERVSITQRMPYLLAKLSLPFYESYHEGGPRFDIFCKDNFVDFGEGFVGSAR